MVCIRRTDTTITQCISALQTPAMIQCVWDGVRAWLAQQSAYDLWQAEQRFKATPMRVQPAPAMAI